MLSYAKYTPPTPTRLNYDSCVASASAMCIGLTSGWIVSDGVNTRSRNLAKTSEVHHGEDTCNWTSYRRDTDPLVDKAVRTCCTRMRKLALVLYKTPIRIAKHSENSTDRQWRSSSFHESKKVRVSRDLYLDLEHTLDACWPGVHHVQVWWRSGHLSARRSDLRKSLQTDKRTDDGRRAIALAHSWNELKTSAYALLCTVWQFLTYFSAVFDVVGRPIGSWKLV